MNAIIDKYLYDLEVNRHEVSTKTRIRPLTHYFSFLAEEFDLSSDEEIREAHIAKTTIETIKKYEKKLEGMDYSTRTIRERLTFVKSFYTYCINDAEDCILMKHPFHNFTMPKKVARDIKIFDPDYYVDFVSRIDGQMKYRNRAIAAMLMTTGIKLIDLTELGMDDMIFDAEDVPVEMIVKDRKIPLNKAVKIILKEYFEKERSSLTDVGTDPVFISRKRNPIHKTTIQLMLNEQARNQKIDPETVAPIALRTLAITTYRQCGGGDIGLRDFFGKNIRQIQFPTTNVGPFLDNPLIDGLYELFND